MEDKTGRPLKTLALLWLLVIGHLVFFYGPSLYSAVMNSDISILVGFAGRILDGMKLSEAYFDPNPPMSMLIYVPTVWLSRLTDIPVYNVHFFFTAFIVLGMFVLCAVLLKRVQGLDSTLKHVLLISGLMGLFYSASIHFGDRDHLIICGLLPFVLVQILYLQDISVPPYLKIPALMLGTLAVLIKPHYGLLPAVLIAWRFVKTRDFKIVLHSDFLFLAVGVVAYIAVIFVFFDDYLFVVFPDVVKFYAPIRHPVIWPEFMAYTMLLCLCAFAVYESRQSDGEKKTLYTLCTFCFLMLIAYIAQGKGLNYHRIPYLVFFYMAFAGGVYVFLKRFLSTSISLGISVILCFVALLSFRGLPSEQVTHDTFRELPFSQAMNKYCPKNDEEPCRYFFYHDTSEIIHQLGIYHNAFHASRFTSLWFLPVILIEENKYADGKQDEAIYPLKEILNLKDQYTTMMVQDFQTMQPDVLIILTGEIYDNRSFEFIDYFSYSADFVDVMQNYEHVETFEIKREIYYPGLTTPFTGRPADTIEIYKRRMQ